MQPNIPVAEASETEADLAAHIDAELGLTPPKVEESAPDENPDEPTKTPEPETPAEEPAADPGEGEPAGEEDVTTPTEDEPEEEEVTPPAPSEPATPTDAELSIEVIDADGVTHKISKASDIPKDFAFGTEANLLETLDRLQDLKVQQKEAETTRAETEQQAAITEARNDQFKAWDAEAAELAKAKRLDSSDSERLDAVFAHMNEINTARIKANNPNLITSLEDALDKFEAKEAIDKAAEAKKNDNERAKTKASLIGRSSAAANGDTYVYRAGSARNIDDIPVG